MNVKDKIDKINQRSNNTLMQSLGIEITNIVDGCVFGKMPVDKRTVQPYGLLHGGASAALAESLGSIGGNMHVYDNNEVVVGVEINANHLKSVKSGWVHGTASPIRLGKKIHVWDIKIKNDENELISVSRLTLAVLKFKSNSKS